MKNGGICRRYFLSVSRSGQRKIAKKPVSIPYKKDNPPGNTRRIIYHNVTHNVSFQFFAPQFFICWSVFHFIPAPATSQQVKGNQSQYHKDNALLFLMVQKSYFQNTYHFFIFGIKFPCPFFDNHFIVIIEPFQHGCIIFFIHPFERLIGRCPPGQIGK